MTEYFDTVQTLLSNIRATQGDAIAAAGKIVGETVAAGGLTHTFGSGHSGAIAYEGHGRAGGLAAVSAIIDPMRGLTERVEGYGRAMLTPVKLAKAPSSLKIHSSPSAYSSVHSLNRPCTNSL